MRHDLPPNLTARIYTGVNEICVSFFRYAGNIRYEIALKVRVLSERFVPSK